MALYAAINERSGGWDWSRPMEAQPDWPAHAAFMDALAAEGFIVLGGPLEGSREVLLILRAEDEAQIRARMADDPWVKSGLLRLGKVWPWTVRLGSLG
jgi:uncharacterized protein YciI